MRTTKVEILGKEYHLAFSAKSQMAMEQLQASGFDMKKHSTEFFYKLLSEELRAGYRRATLAGEAAEEPPKDEDLVDLLGMEELGALVPTLLKIQQGDRNVQARPPKKAEADQSGT